MAYVDLNPIRAGIASKPEQSDFTSIQERIHHWQEQQDEQSWLKPMRTEKQSNHENIPFALADYFEFVDWTGRAIRNDKRGAIAAQLPPAMQRLGIDPDEWLRSMRPDGNRFIQGIGRIKALQTYAEKIGRRWLHGMRASQLLFV